MTDHGQTSCSADTARLAPAAPRAALSRWLHDWRAALLARAFSGLHYGHLTIILPSGGRIEHQGDQSGISATLHIHRWRVLRRIISGGDVGFAESYMDGDWSSPDLTAFIRLAARNLDGLSRAMRGFAPIALLERLRHRLRANSRRGSRRNIEFHYDLGNEFYKSWLDPKMIYSSAIWQAGDTLESAQERKLARIHELLRPLDGMSVLEIGCGWGALAAHLAGNGAHVTGLTLSPSQLAHAGLLVSAQGLGEQVDLRLQDYRDVGGQYDRIVSIEMIEAVGEAYWPTYFETIRRCLKPGGVAVLQVITIAEERFESYRTDTDFIQKHVFPGGFLPSKTILAQEVAKAGLTLAASETFGISYAETLAAWRERFFREWDTIAPMGFDTRFQRLWDYYLSYCEGGFREGVIDVGLYTIERPTLA